jgi:ATP-binding cassette, subfamily B, multidrug efflux pump
MGFLKKYAIKYWKLFLSAILFLMLEAVCDLLQPTIMSKIIDIGVENKRMGYVLYMGGLMLAVTALGAFGAVNRNFLSSRVSQRFGAELRSDLFKKIQSLSFDNIDKFETSSLITRVTNDVNQIQNFVMGTMRIFVKAPMLAVGSIVMAILLNARMAMILIIIVPVVGTLIFLNAKIGFPFFRKVQRTIDRINGVTGEYLAGVRVVKAFNRFNFEEERFARANSEMAEVSATALRVMSVFTPSITLTVNLGIVLVLWLGGLRVNSGNMHVGQIIAFTNYMTQILISLMMISFVFTAFVRAKASTERIGEVLIADNNITNPEKAIAANNKKVGSANLKPGYSSRDKSLSVNFYDARKKSTFLGIKNGVVEFNGVNFSYAGAAGDPVLKDITFKCKVGETIGIIGSTGSGKSSLINLIPRFYDATSGSVKIDEVDVKDMDLAELREKIAVVPQKTVLFTGTIINNIKWGKEDASLDEVIEAARIAHAHDFISALPEGYNTLLGQGGVNLSGGQKQRVSIARALIKKPEILILDDSTSAVDMATEADIREKMKKYLKNMTCFIIGQRITSVMGADRIIVLDNGEIVGIGTHEILLQSCEVYKDIFRSQIGKEGI